MRVLFVENRDSFSWNVIAALPVPREAVRVVSAREASAHLGEADLLVVGPGPMDPARAGLVELVREAARRELPCLGVCLGHQAIGLAFGARLVRSRPAHGQRARATFSGATRLPGIAGVLEVMRYHSLSLEGVEAPLRVTARLDDGLVMALEHEVLPLVGVQFHPDSFATPRGRELLDAAFKGLGVPGAPKASRHEGDRGSSVSAPPRADVPPAPVAHPADEPGPPSAGEEPGGVTPAATAEPRAAPRGLASPAATKKPGAAPRGPVQELSPLELSLAALEGRTDFALLAPGYEDSPHWTLIELGLDARADDALLWFARAEARTPVALSGRAVSVTPLFDVAPVALAPRVDDGDFVTGVGAIREAIAAGDVYQVNLTVRAHLPPVPGSALLATLCRERVPRFAAWVRSREVGELVSASPELLVARDGHAVRVEPMKGTAPAGQRAWLEASEKDRAELAMITDLLRDDLHRLCVPGSVAVADERRFLELPYAVQTVSDVRGELPPATPTSELLARLHPGGSVTGAPREAACAVIAQLEPTPRGAYCGLLGLEVGPRARVALLIRTAERTADGWCYGVGGGITWDSDAQAELREVHLKLGALGAVASAPREGAP